MKNVFVVGLDDFHLRQLRSMPEARDCAFHPLFSYADIFSGETIPVEALLNDSLERLSSFDGSIDAIVGYWDFPVSTVLPLLRERFGLASPSLESVLKCEHKYWSRLEQASVIPNLIPDFVAINPFDSNVLDDIPFDYPFWIKPVKSLSSHLGFKVRNRSDFEQAVSRIRNKIDWLAEPFDYLLRYASRPADVADIDGRHCVVETLISSGRQCTLEGYVHRGGMEIYGVVDSVREGQHRSCFSRYQYPSTIPRHIQMKMVAATQRFLTAIGYDDSPFNAEFYWDASTGTISLLEVNTRISRSHSPLFKLVDGEYNHRIMLSLGMGEQPRVPVRQGPYPCAAKFMWREYRDARVKTVPSEAMLQDLGHRYPGTEIEFNVSPGVRLSDMAIQDSYSYEIGVLFVGGRNRSELLHKYNDIRRTLEQELVLGPVATSA